MFWNKKTKSKELESNNEEIVDNNLKSYNSDYLQNNELTNILEKRISNWLYSIKESEYEIEFIFNDWWKYSWWNANKSFAWLSNNNKFISPTWEVIKYEWRMRPSMEVIKQLMIWSYDEAYKKCNIKLPREIQEALALKQKTETFVYEIENMQKIIQSKKEELENEKNIFKEKYWADIVSILKKIKCNNSKSRSSETID